MKDARTTIKNAATHHEGSGHQEGHSGTDSLDVATSLCALLHCADYAGSDLPRCVVNTCC